jgi:hypothetical protein
LAAKGSGKILDQRRSDPARTDDRDMPSQQPPLPASGG